MTLARVIRQASSAVGVVLAATLLASLTQANAVTAGFVFFIAVLGLAVWQGFLAGTIGSLLATACFNFFFLPPIGTFHVVDPQNWAALACFLITATVASRLVARERARAAEAESRRREIAALYDLCVDLFTAGAEPGGLDAATSRALRTIGAQGGGLVLFPEGQAGTGPSDWVGEARDLEVHRLLERVPLAIDAGPPRSSKGWRNAKVPVMVGDRIAGVLAAYGTRANTETIESVARLLALALERERFLAEQARLEALQASDSFKTSLLRAVSHDLSTPLTAILLALESLKREVANRPEGARTVALLVEEATRLNRRIQNLLAMARLEAGSFVPHREPTPPADLFHAARENLRLIVTSRSIESRVAADCPDLDVDPTLALEILVNLIENAHRVSPPGAPVELVAGPHPSDRSRVRLEVLDRGSGLATAPLRLGGASSDAGEPGADDAARKRLGLEIARSFAAAHGGEVTLLPREGGGVCARIELPAAQLDGAPVPESC